MVLIVIRVENTGCYDMIHIISAGVAMHKTILLIICSFIISSSVFGSEKEITILEKGKKPRIILRYDLTEGDRFNTETIMNQKIKINNPMLSSAAKYTELTFKSNSEAQIEKTHINRGYDIQSRLTGMSLIKAVGVDKEKAEADLQQRVLQNKQWKVALLTFNGIAVKGDYNYSPVSNVLGQGFANIAKSISEFNMFPEEAIGVGGRWQISMFQDSVEGIEVHYDRVCEIHTISGTKVSYSCKFYTSNFKALGSIKEIVKNDTKTTIQLANFEIISESDSTVDLKSMISDEKVKTITNVTTELIVNTISSGLKQTLQFNTKTNTSLDSKTRRIVD